MLDIGFMEILVIGALALIVVGPKDLPGLLRTVGQYAGKARAMAREFQRTMEDAAREADLGDVADAVKGKNKLPFGNQVTDHLKDFEKSVKSEITDAQRAGEAAVRDKPVKPATPTDTPAKTAAVEKPAEPKPQAAEPTKAPDAPAPEAKSA